MEIHQRTLIVASVCSIIYPEVNNMNEHPLDKVKKPKKIEFGKEYDYSKEFEKKRKQDEKKDKKN